MRILGASGVGAGFIGVLVLALWPTPALGHPVPRGDHDRTIVVRLTPDSQRMLVYVSVSYRLEVDELTVLLEDMPPFRDKIRLDLQTRKPIDVYADFATVFAPILARNFIGSANDQPLSFDYGRPSLRKTDEYDKPLGHLRYDFEFRSGFSLKPGVPQSVVFGEHNFERRRGQIKLSFNPELSYYPEKPCGQVLKLVAPDAAIQAKTPQELMPGDDAKLRELTVVFQCPAVLPAPEQKWRPEDEFDDRSHPNDPDHTVLVTKSVVAPTAWHDVNSGLHELFMDSKHGTAVLLLLSALIGAAHALTPGHGKTLVAAYLVGRHGSVAHACLLGVVTTITHTGVVLAIAGGLLFVPDSSRQMVAGTLGVGMGIALFCLGAWLLLQRLAGRADHYHLPSSSSRGTIGKWGLIVMGMTGGIAPCWDAVAMLGLAIGTNLLWLALPMLLAFSAGLAAVLVVIGILVVHARKMLDARWSNSRIIRLLPILSALFIAGMGIVVCMQGMHQ